MFYNNIEELNRVTMEFHNALISNADRWVPAAGGKEEAFIARSGAKLLYCYNPRLHAHAYLNVHTDIILTDEEARMHLGIS
jgi:hypothetical protein